MSTLVLVRHGQARPFEPDSDRLSDLGRQQARLLGEYWLRGGVGFDEVYSGTLVRQRHTAELVGEAFTTNGASWPVPQTTADLNEYDAEGVIKHLIPALAARDEAFSALVAAFEQHRATPERNRHFQRMFEQVTAAWLRGEIEMEGVEAWAAFNARAFGALRRIINAEGNGRRVVVFTSGGVIGLAVQAALEAPTSKGLDLNWRVRNCSLTEFTFSRGRLSLDSFNCVPHLSDADLRTYR